MELMAQHKYGVRFKDNTVFVQLSRTLGLAAVTVDMLEVKHASPVSLSTQNHCGGASRGSFIGLAACEPNPCYIPNLRRIVHSVQFGKD